MHLWTEYEGNTVAGFTLGRLSRSEGRSAFFLTSTTPTDTTQSKPALLRLTETHFDEGELTTRWQAAAKVSHPNLQAVYQSGQTSFEGTALAWCLLEATDASLSDILPERALTKDEALQVTEAVAGALHALHGAGLIHEHVDPTNVFAVGEVVKLRSDCVRECAGDFEADTPEAREELRKRDVHDLGLLLRRCLTAPGQDPETAQLPNPFDRIVRRALNGSVSCEGIAAEMEALKPAPPPPPRPAAVATASPAYSSAPPANGNTPNRGATPVPLDLPLNRPPAATRAPMAPNRAASAPIRAASAVAMADEENISSGVYNGLPRPGAGTEQRFSAAANTIEAPATQRVGSLADETLEVGSLHQRSHHGMGRSGSALAESSGAPWTDKLLQHKAWVASGAVALIGIVLWATTGTSHHASTPATSTPAVAHTASEPAVIAVEQPSGKQPATGRTQSANGRVQSATPAASPRNPAQASLLTSGEQAGWRVIAYTYNYEKQAQAKVAKLQRRYSSLHPQVFSPSGHAPYLVALGGPSDAETAMAIRNRARRSGLPRDTFARNF